MDKQTLESYNNLRQKLADNHKEICDNFHSWQDNEIDSETHDKNSRTLYETKRKILADIGALFDDNRYERFKP